MAFKFTELTQRGKKMRAWDVVQVIEYMLRGFILKH